MSLRHLPIAAQRQRNANIRAHAERIAQSVAIPPGREPIPIAVVPANTRETAPLPLRTRRAFLDRLQATLRRVFAAAGSDSTAKPTAEVTAAYADAHPDLMVGALDESGNLAVILGRSCATCRGECCTAGGDHAFLREDSLRRVRAQYPELTAEALLTAYAAHLPRRHYRGSCVYHTSVGCALPRDLRSNLCNRYVCGGLTQLKSALRESGSTMAFVGAADSVHLRRLALIDVHDARPVALS